MAAVMSLGLGKTMEKKLHAVGIHSAEELVRIGSKQGGFTKMKPPCFYSVFRRRGSKS